MPTGDSRQGGWLAVLVLAGCATSTAPARPAFAPLAGADCLDPGQARGWQEVSRTELHVDAGRRRYRITLDAGCARIGTGSVLRFAGDPIGGRVCGVPTDAVVFDEGLRCRIDRLELIPPSAD